MDKAFMDQIKESHDEEMEDVKKYKEWAKIAEQNGCDHIKGILCDIANDEKTHAKALQHILEMEVAK